MSVHRKRERYARRDFLARRLLSPTVDFGRDGFRGVRRSDLQFCGNARSSNSFTNFCVKVRDATGLMVRSLIRGRMGGWRERGPSLRTLLEILIGGFLASFAATAYLNSRAPAPSPAAKLATSVVLADEGQHRYPSSKTVEAKASHAPIETPVPEETTVAAPAVAPTIKGHAALAAAKPTNHPQVHGAFDVEPVQGRLKLVVDAWALSQPSDASPRVERVHGGNYLLSSA